MKNVIFVLKQLKFENCKSIACKNCEHKLIDCNMCELETGCVECMEYCFTCEKEFCSNCYNEHFKEEYTYHK